MVLPQALQYMVPESMDHPLTNYTSIGAGMFPCESRTALTPGTLVSSAAALCQLWHCLNLQPARLGIFLAPDRGFGSDRTFLLLQGQPFGAIPDRLH